MINRHAKTIEFDAIIEQLAAHAASDTAKDKARTLTPFLREAELRARMAETTGARIILDGMGQPPVAPMTDVSQAMRLAALGDMLTPEQLSGIALFTVACRRMQSYLKRAETIERMVSFYGQSLHPLDALHDEIEQCIRGDQVDDHASSQLRDIRRKMETTREQIKAKLESLLRGHKDWFSDGFVVTRGDRYALPVKKQHKAQIPGAVLDTSSTGQTLFIEPASTRKLSDDLSALQVDEDNEIRRILYTLTALVASHQHDLSQNIATMETLDFIFAKAKLSAQMGGIQPQLTTERRIVIHGGRHPLLDPEKAVPLDLSIGGDIQGVIITGPNTGGKTVSLKTVGLLSMMAQCGLHVPVQEDSVFSLHANVLCDIGDGQSISENLSTFSAHMTNIIHILQETTHESLVLLDELGSGTDPAEGMGLAVAILEELRMRGCLFIATSHYPEIKDYAVQTPGLTNARMTFDRESLAPQYRLQMGEAGESCALYIAQRLGFPKELLARAEKAAYAAQPEKAQSVSFRGADLVPRKKTASRIVQQTTVNKEERSWDKYRRGDSVRIFPQKEIGIVFQTADERGNIGVQVKGKKVLISHKRLQLLVAAEALYPDDYDFSIVFDTVANRKAKSKLDRGNPNAVIVHEKDDLW